MWIVESVRQTSYFVERNFGKILLFGLGYGAFKFLMELSEYARGVVK